jgi:hypothetical protein
MHESVHRPEFVARVAYELKILVGYGVIPSKIRYIPRLRGLAGADSAPLSDAVQIVRLYLVEQVASLSGTYDFDGRQIEADRMRWAYRLLLKIEGKRQNADKRRERAIEKLGTYHDVETWRPPVGPEMDFMLILADQMTKPRP